MKFKSNCEDCCPVCNSANLKYGLMEVQGNLIYYPWVCEDCSTEGQEWYDLSFIGHNIITKDGRSIQVKEGGEQDEI